ncbi:MAG: PKD-like domain-containing protein [Weeksellaceae bacterium]
MKNFKLFYYLMAFTFILSACADDDDSPVMQIKFVETDYTDTYNLQVGDTLQLNPALENNTSSTRYAWYLNDQIIGEKQALSYVMNELGTYEVLFKATKGLDEITRTYTVIVADTYNKFFRPKTENSSPYISKVLLYNPAPGQFMNTGVASLEAAEGIVGGNTGLLSLGAWGGYVEFTFDHTIENQTSARDFVIFSNAFNGSSEPGIVQVSFDENGNGIADDTWYEIAGDAHYEATTIRDYEITYYNPHDTTGIPFKDNQGNVDTLRTNTYHKQPYYPEFINDQDSVTFKGTKVNAPFYKNEKGWVVSDNLAYGYVDNYSNEFSNLRGNTIDISWAVDENLEPVKLKGIDFVRVYTGSFDQSDILGEMSTEVAGAADLSILSK